MKIELLEVAGFKPAFKGMRNPMNSWELSDSSYLYTEEYGNIINIGVKDMKLAQNLVKAGSEHGKFLRQIQVWLDITAPRYFWQEADTYSFGTKNSCSTIHKLHANKITIDDFESYDTLDRSELLELNMKNTINDLNFMREKYIETKDYKWVIEMKNILPESYLQLRTWNTNYAELMNIYNQRNNHKLPIWREFCGWCYDELPYFKELCVDIV